jgi:hypothetical protein
VGPTARQNVLDKGTISYPWRPAISAVIAPPYRVRYSGMPAVDLSTTEHFILMNSEKKLAALSMLHKAKKAYYACDVICTRTLFTCRQAVAIAT